MQWPKITFGAKCNGESVEVSAKYIPKKCILGKIQWPKITFGAKCNGESVEVSAKYIQMHSGQNTKEKNCIWGKIQWRKA